MTSWSPDRFAWIDREGLVQLGPLNELRNRIVHGQNETVRKKQVTAYMNVWRNFAERFDAKVARELRKKIGKDPW